MHENKDVKTGTLTDQCPCDRECTPYCSCPESAECEELVTTLEQDICDAVFNERERAGKKHGFYNSSLHESYAIMLEEFEEAEEALARARELLSSAWTAVRCDDGGDFKVYCAQLTCAAIDAAGECIQLAAMADKGYRSAFEKEDI